MPTLGDGSLIINVTVGNTEVAAMLLVTVVILAAIATAVALVMGIRSMAHGGEYDREHSGELMNARVALQAVAFVLMLVGIYLLAH